MNTKVRKKFSLLIKFNCHDHNGIMPEFFVTLNNEALTVVNAEAQGQAVYGENTIAITLTNKITNVNGYPEILEKLGLEIDKFLVDNIDLTHWIKESNSYITIENIQEKTYGYLHRNGTLTYKFLCPTFYHLRNINLIKTKTSIENAALE